MTKSVLLITLLVTIITASHVNGQPIVGGLPVVGPLLGGGAAGGVGGVVGGLPVVGPILGGDAGGGGLPVVGGGGLLQLVSITGQVSCSPNATVGVNRTVTAAPPFANAIVNLVCESNVVGSVTATVGGLFTMGLNPIHMLTGSIGLRQSLLTSLLSPDCNLVVTAPLSTCNPSLPSTGGFLTSPLTLITTVLQGILNIITLGPLGFVLSGGV